MVRPVYYDPMTTLYHGNCAEVLRDLPEQSVHCVVTSPPYWGALRTYKALGPGQLGHEKNPAEYVEKLVGIFREVKRVLRDDGTCWVNIGDTYTGGGRGPASQQGSKQRTHVGTASLEQLEWNEVGDGQLVGIPWRLALALQADGWRLRADVIWHKPAPMPESVNGWRWEQCKFRVGNNGRGREDSKSAVAPQRPQQDHDGRDFAEDAEWRNCPGCRKCAPNDGLVLRRGQWRPTKAHEYLFMLTKSDCYYGDRAAVAESLQPSAIKRAEYGWKSDHPSIGMIDVDHMGFRFAPTTGRNKRSVWTIGPEPLGLPHFAAFPTALPETCILASTSAKGCCPKCGAPWARVIERPLLPYVEDSELDRYGTGQAGVHRKVGQAYQDWREANPNNLLGWRATCRCEVGLPVPCTVLDPFAGTGSTNIAARRLGRRSIGIDLSAEYVAMAQKRIMAEQPGMTLGV